VSALPRFERGDGFLRLGYRRGTCQACAWPPGKFSKLTPGLAAILAMPIVNHVTWRDRGNSARGYQKRP